MSAKRRVPAVPSDFKRALRRDGLLGFFMECAYVHRAGYVSWITTASRAETRRLRIRKAMGRLLALRAEEMNVAGGEMADSGRRGFGLGGVAIVRDEVRRSA